MSAILCPFLLAVPSRHLISNGNTMTPDYGDDRNTNPRACVGSRCAKWVPEVEGKTPQVYFDADGDPIVRAAVLRTGRGWCSENLRRAPFADPAAPKGGGS